MTRPSQIIRPVRRCFQCAAQQNPTILFSRRVLSTTTVERNEASLESTPQPAPVLDPMLVSTRKEEQQLLRTGVSPIGSRRRRVALQNPSAVPFEQLPYQCFQEARKVLAADREEKLKQIEEERRRIAKWQAKDAAQCGGETSKKGRLIAMQQHLEHLKILADSNDPMIKKRFEDGEGISPQPPLCWLPSDTAPCRRLEPPHLPASRGPRMALLSTAPNHATHHTNAHRSRPPPIPRPRRGSAP